MEWTAKGFNQLKKEVAGIETISCTEQPQERTLLVTLTGTDEACETVESILEKNRPVGFTIIFN